MIPLAILVIASVLLFLIYLYIGKSQAVVELRALIKNSIFQKKIVDIFPTSTGFHPQQKIKNTNKEADTLFFPQSPGDFSDTIKLSPFDSILQNTSNFRASKSKFIQKPYNQSVRKKNKTAKRSELKLNPPLMPFRNDHVFIAPGAPQDPDDETESTENKGEKTENKEEKTENKGEKTENKAQGAQPLSQINPQIGNKGFNKQAVPNTKEEK